MRLDAVRCGAQARRIQSFTSHAMVAVGRLKPRNTFRVSLRKITARDLFESRFFLHLHWCVCVIRVLPWDVLDRSLILIPPRSCSLSFAYARCQHSETKRDQFRWHRYFLRLECHPDVMYQSCKSIEYWRSRRTVTLELTCKRDMLDSGTINVLSGDNTLMKTFLAVLANLYCRQNIWLVHDRCISGTYSGAYDLPF